MQGPSPASSGYRSCDSQVGLNENSCWTSYAQGQVPNTPECWDQTWAQFAQLSDEQPASCTSDATTFASQENSSGIKSYLIGTAGGGPAKFKFSQTNRFCRRVGLRLPSMRELRNLRSRFGANGFDAAMEDGCIWTKDAPLPGYLDSEIGTFPALTNQSSGVVMKKEAVHYCYAVCIGN